MYTASIVTAAFFTALIVVDIIQNTTDQIFQHSILGFISVLIITVLSQKGYGFVSWGLLALPAIALVISFAMVFLKGNGSNSISTAALSAATPSTPSLTSMFGAISGTTPPSTTGCAAATATAAAACASAPAPVQPPIPLSNNVNITPSVKC